MAEVVSINDNNLDSTLQTGKPVLLLFSGGHDLRGDFSTAFKKAAGERDDMIFASIDPKASPQAAERFNIGSKAVLLGLFNGEELVRRSRPWGTDVPLAIERLQQVARESAPPVPANTQPDKHIDQTKQPKESELVDNAPVTVTDETFQAEVIDYSDNMPVLIDFWAEWCGPCKMVAPILEKLAGEYAGKIRVAKVDTDANPGLAQYFRIMSIPTIMILKNRTQVFSQPGAFPEAAFRDLIEQAIALEVPSPEELEEEQEEPAN